jgi:hypothetical protein
MREQTKMGLFHAVDGLGVLVCCFVSCLTSKYSIIIKVFSLCFFVNLALCIQKEKKNTVSQNQTTTGIIT